MKRELDKQNTAKVQSVLRRGREIKQTHAHNHWETAWTKSLGSLPRPSLVGKLNKYWIKEILVKEMITHKNEMQMCLFDDQWHMKPKDQIFRLLGE